VLSNFINQQLEKKHTQYFTNNFKHRNLFNVFVKNNSNFQRDSEFDQAFKEVMKPHLQANRFYQEYQLKLEREM